MQAPNGNILWDCTSLIDEATIEAVQALGGLSAVAMSHSHFYASLVEWSYALGRRHREGSLTAPERDRLFGAFLVDCASSYLLLRVEEDVIRGAAALVNQYPLRTADAIQLSSTVLLSRTLQEAQFDPGILASADDRVLQAASHEGLPVENPNLH